MKDLKRLLVALILSLIVLFSMTIFCNGSPTGPSGGTGGFDTTDVSPGY